MKKVLVFLLALALLLMSMPALAEEGEAVTLELNTAKLPVYAADDPYLNGLTAADDGLPVLVLFTKKSQQLQIAVSPKTVKNKKVDLSVDNEAVARAKGNTVQAVAPGEAVLTIASQEDPSVTLQYRIVVIQPVTRITVAAPAKSVAVGGTMQLTAAFQPADATRQAVAWESANEQVATVDQNGTVTGVKRGNVRITATATDVSEIRANISVEVTQTATEIQLDKPEVTVDAGRNVVLKANVLPKETNNKKVVWSSSDESIATVNGQGRVTGVALGECEITCASAEAGEVQAKAIVHVQQPVKKLTFNEAPFVYNGESAQLTWNIEPADASNQALSFTSSNTKVLTVDENGVVTGVAGGTANVKAVTTDGSNRQAQVKVTVGQHVTGVHMKRHTAYIDLGQTSSAGAILEPEGAKNLNSRVTWETADPGIATVSQNHKDPKKVDITGTGYGLTTVTVTTEDGGFRAPITVNVGDWENSLKWVTCRFDGRGNLQFEIRNESDVSINGIQIEMECFDSDGPVAVNTKTGKNIVTGIYNKNLAPGQTTKVDLWKMQDYDPQIGFAGMRVRIAQFQIEGDWVKVVRKNNRQTKTKYDPGNVIH